MFLPPGKRPKRTRTTIGQAKINSTTKSMDRFTQEMREQAERIKHNQAVKDITKGVSRMSKSLGGGVDKTKSELAASISAAYSYMPTIEVSLLWTFLCCILVFLPLMFVVYMVTKLDSNCNIAWILSWTKIHPCWVDLGPHGHNWQFAMEGYEAHALNQTQLERIAYYHCGLYGTMPVDC